MATLRTEEEKSAILSHCLKLEREGGDILGYLWSQNYLTPRATWFNYQREWLGRKPYQYTDGKPRKEKKMARKSTIPAEIKEAAIKAYLAGGQPCTVLRNAGVKNPSSAWTNIKKTLEAKHPEAAEKLKADTEPLELEAGKNYDISVKDAMDNIQEAADEFFDQCVDMGLKVDKPKITKPLTYDGLEVTAVKHPELGEFYYDRKFASIDWRTPEGDEVSLGPVWWKKMAEDLPKIMAVLGVDV